MTHQLLKNKTLDGNFEGKQNKEQGVQEQGAGVAAESRIKRAVMTVAVVQEQEHAANGQGGRLWIAREQMSVGTGKRT